MRYVVAVSGGVDSMVLLDQLCRQEQHELIVAHFDHGIRPDSAADARFVEAVARQHGLPFVSKRVELGPGASEEVARWHRYDFLQRMAQAHDAVIVTAHHADDVIETMAINIQRGTGWRGLAVLDRPKVIRPLLAVPKQQLREYALEHRLEWVEDSTNASDTYTRNRLRRRIARQLGAVQRTELSATWQHQRTIKREIDKELERFMSRAHEYSRHVMVMIDDTVAYELLRAMVVHAGGPGPLRAQAERALIAIKTARPGSIFELGGGVRLKFTLRTFVVEHYS